MPNQVRVYAGVLANTLTTDIVDPSTGTVVVPQGTTFVLLPETHAKAVLIDDTHTLHDLWDSLSKTDHTHAAATTSANGFMSSDDKAKLNSLVSGTCSTAAGTAAKTVDASGFTLRTGAFVCVRFTNTNTASNPTLNVNSTGAKSIYFQGTAIDAGFLVSGNTYLLCYNGTQYDVVASEITSYQTQLVNYYTLLTNMQARLSTVETELAELKAWAASMGYQAS